MRGGWGPEKGEGGGCGGEWGGDSVGVGGWAGWGWGGVGWGGAGWGWGWRIMKDWGTWGNNGGKERGRMVALWMDDRCSVVGCSYRA